MAATGHVIKHLKSRAFSNLEIKAMPGAPLEHDFGLIFFIKKGLTFVRQR